MAKIKTAPIHPEGQPSSPLSAEEEATPNGGRTLDNAVVSPAELAAYLRVDTRVVYQMIGRQEIPGVRQVGRQYRIDRESVLKWLADGQGRAPRSTPRR
jgi:excisionase family DNA binding protein